MNKAPNNNRKCRTCGARLSLYNEDILCYPCQEKKESSGIANYESTSKVVYTIQDFQLRHQSFIQSRKPFVQ